MEAIPVHLLPFHFRSYAKTNEEAWVDTEINELETEEELEEYNRKDVIDFEDQIVATSIESDFEIDENGVLIAYHGTDE